MSHVFREANSYVDMLARMGAYLNSDFQILYNPPDVMVDLLAKEKSSIICCNKLIVQQCYFQASLTKEKRKREKILYLRICITTFVIIINNDWSHHTITCM